jgi:ribosomal protein S9
VHAGRDDQHAFLRGAIASHRQEALPYVVAKQARSADIEAQLDGGGNFVDVLAARTGGANKGHCQFGIWNEYRQMLFPG